MAVDSFLGRSVGRWRRVPLWLIFTGLMAILLTVLAFVVYQRATTGLRDAIEKELYSRGESLANLLARSVAGDLAFSSDPDIDDEVESVAREEQVLFVVVTDENGDVVAEQVNEPAEFGRPHVRRLMEAADARAGGEGGGLHAPDEGADADLFVQRADATFVEHASPAFDPLLMEEVPAAGDATEEVKGYVYLAISKGEMRKNLEDVSEQVLKTTAVMLLASIAVAVIVSLWATRPLKRMVRDADAMSKGEYASVSEAKTGGFISVKEVADLAVAFSVMRASLAEVAEQARRIAEGDLTRRVRGAGKLGDAFNAMVASLSNLVGQIKKASIHIASSSSEILAASKQAEKGSAEQASSINETTTTMDELLSASKQIASSADSVVQIAERTLEAAVAGEDAVKEGIRGMQEIAQNNKQTAERILELSERNQEIGNIVDLIDEIADKSDLLALNAAIEGAKAGEAGKGFAVVATEMRALAENVVESTKEIKSLISQIQKASNASVLATEGQMKATERGTSVAQKTAEHLQQILQMVEQTTEAAKQISLATQQQRTGTEQVVHSMAEIAKIAKSNVAGAGQTTSSTVELANLAEELKQAVSQFHLGPEDR